MWDGPVFILGILPGAAIVCALLLAIASRRREGRSRWLLVLLAFFLMIPIVLIEWLGYMLIGPRLGNSATAELILPILLLVLAGYGAYKLALLLGGAGSSV